MYAHTWHWIRFQRPQTELVLMRASVFRWCHVMLACCRHWTFRTNTTTHNRDYHPQCCTGLFSDVRKTLFFNVHTNICTHTHTHSHNNTLARSLTRSLARMQTPSRSAVRLISHMTFEKFNSSGVRSFCWFVFETRGGFFVLVLMHSTNKKDLAHNRCQRQHNGEKAAEGSGRCSLWPHGNRDDGCYDVPWRCSRSPLSVWSGTRVLRHWSLWRRGHVVSIRIQQQTLVENTCIDNLYSFVYSVHVLITHTPRFGSTEHRNHPHPHPQKHTEHRSFVECSVW